MKKMKAQKNVYIAVLVLVVIGVGWYLFSSYKPDSQSTTETQNTAQNVQDVSGNQETDQVSGEAKFIVGTVLKISGQKIYIDLNSEEKVVVTNNNTSIIKAIKVKGVEENQSASLDDIKSGTSILVSYRTSSGSEYRADIVKILGL